VRSGCCILGTLVPYVASAVLGRAMADRGRLVHSAILGHATLSRTEGISKARRRKSHGHAGYPRGDRLLVPVAGPAIMALSSDSLRVGLHRLAVPISFNWNSDGTGGLWTSVITPLSR
jgi:hypothetical protein